MSGTWAGRRLHFIGIGGAGMSGPGARRPRAGRDGHRVRSGRVVVLRAAARGRDRAGRSGTTRRTCRTAPRWSSRPRSPSRTRSSRARASGAQRVLHRGDLLAEASTLKRCIAVSGTHGKTTTSGDGRARPGRDRARPGLPDRRRAALDRVERRLGRGRLDRRRGRRVRPLVPEGRARGRGRHEHRGRPPRAPTRASSTSRRRSPAGSSGGRDDDRLGRRAAAGGRRPLRRSTRATCVPSGVVLDAAGRGFAVDGVDGARCACPAPHNVLNALAALAARARRGRAAGRGGRRRWRRSAGAKRRFEWRGLTDSGAAVVDDYAHHPTEVAATLEAARTIGPRRLVACFQPHLYSRTQHLQREFGRALALADVVVVIDIYPAREDAADYPGVTGFLVARAAADAARRAPGLLAAGAWSRPQRALAGHGRRGRPAGHAGRRRRRQGRRRAGHPAGRRAERSDRYPARRRESTRRMDSRRSDHG